MSSIASDIAAKRVRMAISEVRDGSMPVQRDLTAGECQELLKISKKSRDGGTLTDGDVKWNICSNAFDFGYWAGWKHAQAEYEDVILSFNIWEDQGEKAPAPANPDTQRPET